MLEYITNSKTSTININSDTMSKNQFIQKFKLTIKTLKYVIYSNNKINTV